MHPVTRLFESEHAAHAAAEKLVEGEVSPEHITIINPHEDGAAERVDALIEQGGAMSGHRRALKEGLGRGRSIVAVTPEWAMGSFVTAVLENNGAVDSDTLPAYDPNDPSPFSDMFGLPVLTDGKSQSELLEFDKDSSFGLDLVSNNPAPFSSMFGLKVLSSKTAPVAPGSSVERMSGNPAPFSSKFGMKTLSAGKGSRAAGSSVERMSGKAAPFSSLLGLRVLSRRK